MLHNIVTVNISEVHTLCFLIHSFYRKYFILFSNDLRTCLMVSANADPLAEHPNIPSVLGHSAGALRPEPRLLDPADRAAFLHEECLTR